MYVSKCIEKGWARGSCTLISGDLIPWIDVLRVGVLGVGQSFGVGEHGGPGDAQLAIPSLAVLNTRGRFSFESRRRVIVDQFDVLARRTGAWRRGGAFRGRGFHDDEARGLSASSSTRRGASGVWRMVNVAGGSQRWRQRRAFSCEPIYTSLRRVLVLVKMVEGRPGITGVGGVRTPLISLRPLTSPSPNGGGVDAASNLHGPAILSGILHSARAQCQPPPPAHQSFNLFRLSVSTINHRAPFTPSAFRPSSSHIKYIGTYSRCTATRKLW